MPLQDQSATRVSPIRLSRWLQLLRDEAPGSSRHHVHHQAPYTSSTRVAESRDDNPLDPSELLQKVATSTVASKETVLYLAYGSNLCRETFRHKRGIKPVSQLNVVVPELVLTFDLPGIPYVEPCFGNTRYGRAPTSKENSDHAEKEEHHKNSWHKGLVGVVYEVTLADYARIIATEGGGASYEDVLVDCYVLPKDPNKAVPMHPSGDQLKAHTLFAPAARPTPASNGTRLTRPDPSYAQPSHRYLKLITDGARELRLPYEYQDYLNSIHEYQLTTTKQRLGKFLFLSVWGPLIAFILGLGRLFADKRGRYPPWLTALTASIFLGAWSSYDKFFKGIFGDGERTIEPGSDHHTSEEKQALISIRGRSMNGDATALGGNGIAPQTSV